MKEGMQKHEAAIVRGFYGDYLIFKIVSALS